MDRLLFGYEDKIHILRDIIVAADTLYLLSDRNGEEVLALPQKVERLGLGDVSEWVWRLDCTKLKRKCGLDECFVYIKDLPGYLSGASFPVVSEGKRVSEPHIRKPLVPRQKSKADPKCVVPEAIEDFCAAYSLLVERTIK